MALIPAGTFSMGDHYNAGESRERPVHDVYISSFYMEKYEVSKAKWDEVYSWAIANAYSFDNAGSGTATNFPVHTVNWYDCVKWCNARSEKEGLNPVYFTDSTFSTVYKTGQENVVIDAVNWSGNGYRLPTEAEWEKAARGGLSANYYPWTSQGGNYSDHTDGSKANYMNSGDPWDNGTTPCGYYNGNQTPTGVDMANGYGLYDMAGNVWEFNYDWYNENWYSHTGATNANTWGSISGSHRVLRGGGWINLAFYSRGAYRSYVTPGHSDYSIGFRCARGIIPSNYYTISGTVNGDIQENVTITLSGDASATTETSSNGYYSFTGLFNGNYTITPDKSGYTFLPSVTNISISNANFMDIDFIASYDGSGIVHYVSLSGGHVSPFTSWATAATNIQAAVDEALVGHFVLITNGTYYPPTEITITNSITVKSVNGAENTIINGSHAHACVYLTGSILDGFTITNGFAVSSAGGIYSLNGIVRNCIIVGNEAPYAGGGINIGNGIVEYCDIKHNTAGVYGGGVAMFDGGTIIRNCLISHNHKRSSQHHGAGVFMNGNLGGNRIIENCTIVNNTSADGKNRWCLLMEQW